MKIYTTKEAARLLGLKDPSAVRRLILAGRLKAIKHGSAHAITEAALEAFKQQRRGRGRPRMNISDLTIRHAQHYLDLLERRAIHKDDLPQVDRAIGALGQMTDNPKAREVLDRLLKAREAEAKDEE